MQLPPQVSLLRPLLLIAYSLSYIPSTILHLLLPPQPSKLLSWSSFQHAWFANFWTWFGGVSRQFASPVVSPLVLQNAYGVVLDIGPGSGEWVHLYSKTDSKVTKVFGVEPNVEHHVALKRRVKEAGLEGVYVVLPVGAQDLQEVGLGNECVDTIVTVQTLCSCPHPRDVIKSLYPFLKKGGVWVVYEHVKTKYQADFVGYWQRVINMVWPHCFDGCCITRPTDEWLLQAGEWDEVSLKPGEGEGKYDTIPHVVGTLIKRK